MIVRINQFEAPRPEAEAGWPGEGRLGPLLAPWPAGTRAYEILILAQDEHRQPLSESFRQQQLRHLIPQAIEALREAGEQAVVRLDGPLADRELLPAFRHLTSEEGEGRFAISPTRKLEPGQAEVLTGMRIQPSGVSLHSLCSDASLGLERLVRMRVFSVPDELVNVVLDIDGNDDERWADVLDRAGFVLGTVRGLLALHVLSARFDAPTVKGRLMQRLAQVAQAANAAISSSTPARG
jgi:hypothetical protein